jgi:hypothetical protein
MAAEKPREETMTINRIHLVALIVVCVLVGGWGARTLHGGPVLAQALELAGGDVLPGELFAPGQKVMRQRSVYLIEEVRGGWIRARLYQSLDDNAATSTAPRWIYVPADSAAWTKAD